ncbi:hypothetical protein niasHT_030493 [Heterodera trifolii]|uniref:Obg-like ATPase 1 n=1 Tax=Heterodera trifolii TaxID=157864 RepID=A0ABD2J1W9_9BILA
MPPKKQVEQQHQPILGRLGTNLKMGILGLPNVGKSTFFNVLTKSEAQAENFPFCTIDPNESRVAVEDTRFDWLVEHYKPLSRVPAYLTVVDIAGLVKGASEGQGLGNSFLSHVGACDALFHLCRSFEDTEVTHVEGDVDPIRDLEIINSELRLKDQAYLVGALDKVEKLAVRANDKTKNLYGKHEWNEKEIEVLNKHLFLTAKPIVYLVNLSEQDFIKKRNKWLSENQSDAIDENDPGAVLIPFSGAFELNALDKIIKTGYKTLCLEYFFTAGKDEVRAWTIQKGTKAPQGAGRIHTDFEKGFIMAEVMKVADLVELGSENAVKGAGKYRQQGRNYVVEDGDIIFFKFNAGAGLTAAKKK